MSNYVRGWVKITYNFDVYEVDGSSIGPSIEYPPAQYMEKIINKGTTDSSSDEVGDYSYIWDNRPHVLSFYQIGVNGYAQIVNGQEVYGFNSYDLAMLKQRITDIVTDPDFTPPPVDPNDTVTVTLVNTWTGRKYGDAESRYIWTHPRVEWRQASVIIKDEDGNGYDDNGEHDKCPGREELQKRMDGIKEEIEKNTTDMGRAIDLYNQYGRQVDVLMDEYDASNLAHIVVTAHSGLKALIGTAAMHGYKPAAIASTIYGVIEIFISNNEENKVESAIGFFIDAIDFRNSIFEHNEYIGAMTKMAEPAFLAKEYMDFSTGLSERRKYNKKLQEIIEDSKNKMKGYLEKSEKNQNSIDKLNKSLGNFVECDTFDELNAASEAHQIIAEATATGPTIQSIKGLVAIVNAASTFNGDLSALKDVPVAILNLAVGDNQVTIDHAMSTVINGSSGTDTVIYQGALSDISRTIALANDIVVQFADGKSSTLSGIEVLKSAQATFVPTAGAFGRWRVDGTTGADNLTGTNGDTDLYGGNGDDVLQAGDGSDVLDGQAGADTMRGGNGDDTYYVDHAGDLVSEMADHGIDAVISSVTYSLSGHVEILQLAGTAQINGSGNGLNNLMLGNNATNQLMGLGGDDRLDGKDGNDLLQGGDGNDTLIGGAGNDTVDGGDGIDVAMLGGAKSNLTLTFDGTQTKVSGPAGIDIFTNVEIFVLEDGRIITNSPIKIGAFDEGHYLRTHPDVAAAVKEGQFKSGFDHWTLWGKAEGRAAVHAPNDPLYDEHYYLSANPDVAAVVRSGILSSGYEHFAAYGKAEGRAFTPLFDKNFYLSENTDVAAAGVDPWQHFMLYGWREDRDPSRFFDLSAYLDRNPDVKAAGVNVYEHALLYGQSEGRTITGYADLG